MNRFIACALLGFGVASFVTACGDDDSGTDPGTAGSNTGGTHAAGESSGGSAQGGSAAGKANGGSGAGGSSSGGSGTAGSSMAGTGAGGDNMGGEAAVGGMPGASGEAGEGGAGGAPPTEVEEVADPYWLSLFCDAQSAETLACTYSKEWVNCFRDDYPYLPVNGGDGICPNEQDLENFPLTLAMYESMGALATACPDPSVEDWSCDLASAPQPNSAKCAAAIANSAAEYSKCTDAPE